MENKKNESNYDGSEMDEVKSPLILMVTAFLGFLGLGFVYIITWSLLLSP